MTKQTDVLETHWDYMLLLEEDVIDILKYIEPVQENLNTYGPKLAKALLSICSEIDVALKSLRDQQALSTHKEIAEIRTIKDARQMVQAYFIEEFRESHVRIGYCSIVFKPWKTWWKEDGNNSNKNPSWWISYNKVKHNRIENYPNANLENVLNALAALFIVDTCLYRLMFRDTTGNRAPASLTKPKKLLFTGTKRLGSGEALYVKNHSLCVSSGFHVD